MDDELNFGNNASPLAPASPTPPPPQNRDDAGHPNDIEPLTADDDPYLGVPEYDATENITDSENRLATYDYAQKLQELRRIHRFVGRGEYGPNMEMLDAGNHPRGWVLFVRAAERVFPGDVCLSLLDLGGVFRVHLARLVLLLVSLQDHSAFDADTDNPQSRAWNAALQSLEYLYVMRQTLVLWSWATSPDDRTQFHINQSLMGVRINTTYNPHPLTAYQRALIYVLTKARQEGLRREGVMIARPRVVTNEGVTRRLPVYRTTETISQWVYGLMQHIWGAGSQKLTFTPTIVTAVIKALENWQGCELRELKPNGSFIGFKNGVYVLKATDDMKQPRSDEDGEESKEDDDFGVRDAFISYEAMPSDVTAIAYHDFDLDWEAIKDKDPDDIPSVMEEILLAQFPTAEELPVRQAIFAMLGRVFFPVGCTDTLDNWQKALVLLGAAGTGKSTIINWIRYVFNGRYVGIIGNSTQSTFSLHNQVNNKVCVFEEITKDMRLALDIILSMISGGSTEVTKKYGASYPMDWNKSTIITGNDFASWPNIGGGLARRLIVVYFTLRVIMDPTLQTRLNADTGFTIVRLVRSYHKLVRTMRDPSTEASEVCDILPSYFRQTNTQISADANPVEAFIQASEWIRHSVFADYTRRKRVFMQESEFIRLLRQFCELNSKLMPTVKNAAFYHTLMRYDITLMRTTNDDPHVCRHYPRAPFRVAGQKRKAGRFLCGIDVAGIRVHDDPNEGRNPENTRPFDYDEDYDRHSNSHHRKKRKTDDGWCSDHFLIRYAQEIEVQEGFGNMTNYIVRHSTEIATAFIREAYEHINAIMCGVDDPDLVAELYKSFASLETVMNLGLQWPTALVPNPHAIEVASDAHDTSDNEADVVNDVDQAAEGINDGNDDGRLSLPTEKWDAAYFDHLWRLNVNGRGVDITPTHGNDAACAFLSDVVAHLSEIDESCSQQTSGRIHQQLDELKITLRH